MAHEQLPPVPVIDLPKEIAEALIADGLAEPAPNIHTFSAVPDYLQGILLITGGAASAITILDALRKGIHALAHRLHQWHTDTPTEMKPDGTPKQRMAAFRATKGTGRLDLNADPTEAQLEAFLRFAYLLLLDDAENRTQ
jgi:hypothetical protein